MIAQEFINQLSALLHGLPPQERDKAIEYYIELISDKVESGMNEETIIAEFGDVNLLAQTILEENNTDHTESKIKRNNNKPLIIVLLILCSPLLFGLAMGALGVLIGLLGAIFGIVFAFFITSLSLALSGIVVFFASFTVIATNPAVSVAMMGTGLVLLGVAIFLFLGTYYVTKGIVLLIQLVFQSFKKKNKRCVV